MQWIQNNLGIIIIALSFGISGLGWLLQKLKQAQDAKKADQLRQRARLEALRTGRMESPQASSTPSKPMSARDRIEEAARRRQLEQQARAEAQKRDLEEQLRRRREAIEAQKQRPAQGRPPPPPPIQRPGQQPQRPSQQPQRSAQQPQRPAQRPPQTARTPSPMPQRQAGERRRPAPIATPTSAQQAQAAILQGMIDSERQRERIAPPLPPVASPGPTRKAPLSILGTDLRQAIVMREILDRPIALRQAQEPGW